MTSHLTIIVNDDLKRGLIANICSVISASFLRYAPDILGSDIETEDLFYPAITKIPIIILGGANGTLKTILSRAITKDITYVLYDKIALTCHDYQEYSDLIKNQSTQEREIIGIGLIGDKKAIKALTGNLPLLK